MQKYLQASTVDESYQTRDQNLGLVLITLLSAMPVTLPVDLAIILL